MYTAIAVKSFNNSHNFVTNCPNSFAIGWNRRSDWNLGVAIQLGIEPEKGGRQEAGQLAGIPDL